MSILEIMQKLEKRIDMEFLFGRSSIRELELIQRVLINNSGCENG